MKKRSVKMKKASSTPATRKARQPQRKSKVPRGGDAIKEAILEAAEELLARHNPTDISLRQIAKAANVNHSLIHRYFLTKENVILAVHERIISKLSVKFSRIESLDGNVKKLFKINAENPSRRILLARAMLDGADPHLIRHHFPLMDQLVELLAKKKSETDEPTKYDAETLAAFFAGAVMGWFLYEPFLLASTGLEKKNKSEVHRHIVEILEKMSEELC